MKKKLPETGVFFMPLSLHIHSPDMLAYPRIVFYGTPSIAAASLSRMLMEGLNVVAVVTAPDKPAGRGLRLNRSPVKDMATEKGIPVLQPEHMKDPGFLSRLRTINPDLQVVVAFRMMPKEVWSCPPLGTFNLHASLLPQYRGAAPINWAIINGETETGVTTFLLEDKMDTGHILLSEKVSIRPNETAGELHDRLMDIGAGLVIKTVHAIVSGTARPVPQPRVIPEGEKLKPAPKFSREDARIDWSRNYMEVYNLIRGMSPSPGAFTEIPLAGGTVLVLKILHADAVDAQGTMAGNGFQTDRKTFLQIPAGDGYIALKEVQPAGKKIMSIREFLNGFGRLML